MRDMKHPEYVKKILNRIEDAGYEAFVVGGAVRDEMLGRTVNDYDITTSALPEETAKIFSDLHVIMTGVKHGTVTVVSDGRPIEITTYRVDGDYKDSRHPEGVSFTRSIEEDLARRDFTVNAMAYSERRGLVDLFGGRDDLERRLIRAVGEAERRFEEDALRIMRAFRFASKLGFEIEEKTLAAASRCRGGLLNISAERKTVELEGILLGAGVKKTLELMKDTGVLEVVAPAIKLDDTRLNGICALPCDFVCRMAFCLMGQENTDSYISSLKLSNSLSSSIRKLISMADCPVDAESDASLRRLMATAGEQTENLLEIKKALGEELGGAAERVRVIRERGDCLDLRSLAVSGKDLSVLGIEGKDIGAALSFLLGKVLDDQSLNQKERLLNFLPAFKKSIYK